MAALFTSWDVANRCLQNLGAQLISTFADISKNATQTGFIYDKVRRAELRANPWVFARRRAILRRDPLYGCFFPQWVSGAYAVGDIVVYNGSPWVAQGAATTELPSDYPWLEYTGQTSVPAYVPGPYYPGELTFYNGAVFLNLGDNNTAPPPNGAWHHVQGATARPYPYTMFSPFRYTTNTFPTPGKYVFPLPPAYLRPMTQDPKVAGTSAQITTGGAQALDYEIEQLAVLSFATGPIVFRYGADVQIVQTFDDLFYEAVAARMATELCITITGSTQKLQACQTLYDEAIAKAVRINAIEAGSTEPDASAVDSQRGPTREKGPPPQRQQQQ